MSATSTRVRCATRARRKCAARGENSTALRALPSFGIHKINRMQQILKRLDNMQHSLYWLSRISRGYFLSRLSPRGFVFDSIKSNPSCKYVAAFGQAATRPDYA